MGSVSPAQVSDGTTIDASDVNNPINTIANEFNGNIDNTNIKAAAAIAGSKLADNSIDVTTKASSWDGWIQVTDTWTYASSTTVTVPSDATTKYSVGDKVKLTNGSTKYFYITAVASTTLTLNGGSDYTVANSAITGVYYSKAQTPLSFPGGFNFTVAGANYTAGNSTSNARFTLNGKWCTCFVNIKLGSTGDFTGEATINLPITASSNYALSYALPMVGWAQFVDSGTANYEGAVVIDGTTVMRPHVITTNATYSSVSGTSSTIPMNWTTNDALWMQATYEVA